MFKFFEALVDPYQPYPEDQAPPRRLWPFLRAYLTPFRRVFWITGVISALTAAVEIALLWYLGKLVTDMSGRTPAEYVQEKGVELIIVAALILFVRPLIQGVSTLLQNNAILGNVGALVRYRAHRHVLGQSVGWFENDFAGRIANRIMQTPPATGEVVFQVFDAITFSIAYLIGAIILLGQADGRLAVPLILWTLSYGALVVWTVRRIGPASKAASDARSQVTGQVVDSYTNIHSVKLFDHHGQEMRHAKDAIEVSRQTFQYEMRLFTIMDIGLVLLNGALVVGVVGWAIWLWVAADAAIGVVAAAAALTLRLNGMSGWIMWAMTSFFRELGVISEGMETISAPIELVDAPDAKPLHLKEGAIEFADVTHRYGLEKGGLDGVRLTIRPGEKIGLIGRSGAGKSTLTKAVLRFFDIEKGQIKIDGQNIAQVTQSSLRQAMGVVQQDSSLMHRSIRENILYGRPDATEVDLIRATKQAQAYDFIQDLVDAQGRRGFDAQVGERGVKLSGGQRQRIVLARVILKDAPILILDEATSALDSEVEAQIQETLYDMMQGKTVIAIAHRLSTIAKMDRILVMDQGRIIEQGTHAQLLAAGGTYAGFWHRQSGGFLDIEA